MQLFRQTKLYPDPSLLYINHSGSFQHVLSDGSDTVWYMPRYMVQGMGRRPAAENQTALLFWCLRRLLCCIRESLFALGAGFGMELGGSRRAAAVVPKLDIALGAQGPPLDKVALLPHQVLDGDRLIREDLALLEVRTDPAAFFCSP